MKKQHLWLHHKFVQQLNEASWNMRKQWRAFAAMGAWVAALLSRGATISWQVQAWTKRWAESKTQWPCHDTMDVLRRVRVCAFYAAPGCEGASVLEIIIGWFLSGTFSSFGTLQPFGPFEPGNHPMKRVQHVPRPASVCIFWRKKRNASKGYRIFHIL